ncbi:MAG: NAD(P)(+) transhydrogenase (Re/Si-specific) subunit beta [Eubacteriales bacterium]|nr:NAD(P)(+) transhydrogenase (Re/Si-specific) subunit beta [Eubacteriales bacterium]
MFNFLPQFLLVEPVSGGSTQIIYYIISAILSLLVLLGISRMSKVEKAASGNLLGAGSMLAAILLTLWYFGIFTVYELWIGMLIGTVCGLYLSRKVAMIQMPQMVGLLNGFGGLASMLAGILTLTVQRGELNAFSTFTAGLAIMVGGLTWSGSAVAAAKLHRLMNQRPIVWKRHQLWTSLSLILSALSVFAFLLPSFESGAAKIILIIFAVVMSNLFGYIFAIRVGGADMPITISLLNSFSGVAGAIAGMAIGDLLLVAVGGIVGASGLLLTQIMCRSMNRHLMDILLGKTSAPAQPKAAAKSSSPASAPAQAPSQAAPQAAEPAARAKATPGDWLKDAERVIIVPGYGMALSQAQPIVKQLMDELESDGKKVDFAIHPVAGRMPGHMNVLLAEVDVPYEKLFEMDAINDEFATTDVALIIGANDVVNPAANTAEGTPIYGMPVLSVENAKHVIICNFDEQPGYAGVANPLYAEAKASEDHVQLLLGDAKETLKELQKQYRNAGQSSAVSESTEPCVDLPGKWLKDAERVIIVPGYGMALSQAQPIVKQLMDELESDGKKVDFAIHPVAGRMPGHMNVLLAEVDVPYEKLHEMSEIDGEFASTDVALIIGANDVVNPAANTAEGTPIYGMPVLSVENAKHVIICNFDEQPGYAGVPNPLYTEAKDGGDHVALVLGDAKDSLKELQKQYRSAALVPQQASPQASEKQSNPGSWLKSAERVIIVPGYGMALSQAQPMVKQLMDELEDAGKKVDFAIHPVAGRMPGHMNVLLAEVDVPYEKLHEMSEIDGEFASTDVALIIGANDVVNPAANTAEGTPIYGMPVLSVENAKHVIICNFDEQPGYAGVPNPLYSEAKAGGDHVALILGDAKDSLKELREQYRNADSQPEASEARSEAKSSANPADCLKAAERVIIVPGYGMALSQAQPIVKQLMDELEDRGKTVDFAIHPVAGRMPGHMNVLLAEVDVPYEKLHEMESINDSFKDTDVTIIIGANDVINPAANTAEGTPIYGMPVLSVTDSKQIIICNFDRQPGYAGVENPLYSEADQPGAKVYLLLGDAKETLRSLLKGLND